MQKQRTAFKNFPDYKNQIKSFIRQGKQYKEIAKYFGVNSSTISYWRKKMGLSFERTNKDKINRLKTQTKFRKSYFEKYGITYEDSIKPELRELFQKFMKKRASIKGKDKNFTIKFFDLERPEYCPVLGIKLDYFRKGKENTENTVSYDQIEPGNGYTKDNVKIISYRANRLKNNGTAEEHILIAKYIDEHIKYKQTILSKLIESKIKL